MKDFKSHSTNFIQEAKITGHKEYLFTHGNSCLSSVALDVFQHQLSLLTLQN